MKKLIFFFAACCLIFSACKTNNEPEPNKSFRLDPAAKVYIKPAPSATPASAFRSAANTEHLTPLEIVKQAVALSFYNDTLGSSFTGGFSDMQRDTVSEIPSLLRWGTDIINISDIVYFQEHGTYPIQKDFIYAYDMVYWRGTEHNRDTIAYTPNSVLRGMENAIKAALIDKDTTAVYDIFYNQWTFTPITGAEWRSLKAENLQ